MRDATAPANQTIGADLRSLRRARGLTLQDLAAAVGRSIGWLSQVERDLSEPSIEELRSLAQVLDVSVSSLFSVQGEPHETGIVVRAGNRRPIGSREAGLVEELLSPDLSDDFEVVHSTFQPGAHLSGAVRRPTQEVGYIISGKLELELGGTWFSLGEGDSFRIRGEQFRWRNPLDAPCRVVWVIAPPVY